MSATKLSESELHTMMVHNVGVFAAIAVCTATVAVFAQSADGLWSLILALFILKPKSDEEAT